MAHEQMTPRKRAARVYDMRTTARERALRDAAEAVLKAYYIQDYRKMIETHAALAEALRAYENNPTEQQDETLAKD